MDKLSVAWVAKVRRMKLQNLKQTHAAVIGIGHRSAVGSKEEA